MKVDLYPRNYAIPLPLPTISIPLGQTKWAMTNYGISEGMINEIVVRGLYQGKNMVWYKMHFFEPAIRSNHEYRAEDLFDSRAQLVGRIKTSQPNKSVV